MSRTTAVVCSSPMRQAPVRRCSRPRPAGSSIPTSAADPLPHTATAERCRQASTWPPCGSTSTRRRTWSARSASASVARPAGWHTRASSTLAAEGRRTGRPRERRRRHPLRDAAVWKPIGRSGLLGSRLLRGCLLGRSLLRRSLLRRCLLRRCLLGHGLLRRSLLRRGGLRRSLLRRRLLGGGPLGRRLLGGGG